MLTWFDGEWMVICTRGHMIIFQNATSFFAATVWRMVVWASGGCKRRLLSPWFGTKNTSFQKFPFLWAILIEVRNLCGIFFGAVETCLNLSYTVFGLETHDSRDWGTLMISSFNDLRRYQPFSHVIAFLYTHRYFFRFISQNCVNWKYLAGIVSPARLLRIPHFRCFLEWDSAFLTVSPPISDVL